MAKEELGRKPDQIPEAQLLKGKKKREWLPRYLQLIQWPGDQQWEQFVFTDEKLIAVEQASNGQDDRSWSAEAPATLAIIEHHQSPQSVIE